MLCKIQRLCNHVTGKQDAAIQEEGGSGRMRVLQGPRVSVLQRVVGFRHFRLPRRGSWCLVHPSAEPFGVSSR